MVLSRADQIWNRAALNGGGEDPGAGDIALAAMLLAHGLTMNGGVHHAVECLSPEEFSQALNGYNYFGLSAVADIFVAAAEGSLSPCSESTDRLANNAYHQLVPNDGSLARTFEAVLADRPDEFAQVED